jgi:hypothetical protein
MVIKYKSNHWFLSIWFLLFYTFFLIIVEWSTDEDFNDISFDIIKNCFLREYIIRNLSVGQKCYVRVSAGNMKGFGQTVLSNPPYCVPSSMFS